jgi:hypothetical protein
MTDHFVLRVPLITRIRGRAFNTIEAHNQVVKEMGRVAIAKFGNPGTEARVKKLNAQIEEGTETVLVLAVKRGNRFWGYQSRLVAAHYGKLEEKISKIAPSYYANFDEPASLWFVVADPFVPVPLVDFRLSTNDRRVTDVMAECRTPAMLVHKSA